MHITISKDCPVVNDHVSYTVNYKNVETAYPTKKFTGFRCSKGRECNCAQNCAVLDEVLTEWNIIK